MQKIGLYFIAFFNMWNLIWLPWISLGKEELCSCEEYKVCWVCTHSHNIEEFREFNSWKIVMELYSKK